MSDSAPETKPDTTPPPAPEPTPPPPAATPTPQHEDMSARMGQVESAIVALTDAVAKMVPQVVDKAPVRKPWTHWGSR